MTARNDLTATVDTHFTDNSGRADYESIDRFVLASPGPTASAVPNFAGSWVEISPRNPDRPAKLQIAQSGSQLTVGREKLDIVDGVATLTIPQGCAPQLRKPGFDYNGPNLAGPDTMRFSISGQVLTYERTVNWLVPCGEHPKGIEKFLYRFQRE
jgi:hypothetical protein